MIHQALDIYVFRHGETDYNAEFRFQGSIDIPLNDRGRAQATELATGLSSRGIEAIISSPLIRAYETATIIARILNVGVTKCDELREIDCGDAEGRLRSEVVAEYGEAFWDKWRSSKYDDMDLRFTGGESKRECQQRALRCVTDIAMTTPHRVLGLAMHGAILRHLVQAIVGESSTPVTVPNCAAFLLHFHRGEQRWEFVDFENRLKDPRK